MKASVPEFYAGQRILVTGATGFMGKVLVEKILRSCPDVERIYLLMRSKKGKSMEERWKEVTEKPLFDKLKSLRPEVLKKVALMSGDMTKPQLGLSSNDTHEIEESVTMIFHVAADVQFNENICDALIDNVKGTKSILDLAVKTKNLKVFVHVSTAFCNFNLPMSDSVEKIIPSFFDWKILLKLQETEYHTFLQLKEKLLCGHPNPYTWSKSLAEQIVNEYSQYFPTVVMRPAVVMGSLREDPLVGWADSLNGYSAIATSILLGIFRIHWVSKDAYVDVIFVDIATRALLVSAKKAAETKERIAIYNCGTAKILHFTIGYMYDEGKEFEIKYPIKQKVWPMDCLYVPNPHLYSILFIPRQVLPSLFLDFILKLTGNQTIFLKISKKIMNGNRMFNKFTKGFEFPIDNYKALEEYLDEKDKREFSIDVSDMPERKKEILTQQTIGLLKYIFKEDLSSEGILKNRRHLRRLQIAKMSVECIQYLALGWLSWNLLQYLLY